MTDSRRRVGPFPDETAFPNERFLRVHFRHLKIRHTLIQTGRHICLCIASLLGQFRFGSSPLPLHSSFLTALNASIPSSPVFAACPGGLQMMYPPVMFPRAQSDAVNRRPTHRYPAPPYSICNGSDLHRDAWHPIVGVKCRSPDASTIVSTSNRPIVRIDASPLLIDERSF